MPQPPEQPTIASSEYWSMFNSLLNTFGHLAESWQERAGFSTATIDTLTQDDDGSVLTRTILGIRRDQLIACADEIERQIAAIRADVEGQLQDAILKQSDNKPHA